MSASTKADMRGKVFVMAGSVSGAQAEVAAHLMAAGHSYLCSSDHRGVVETLIGACCARRVRGAVAMLEALFGKENDALHGINDLKERFQNRLTIDNIRFVERYVKNKMGVGIECPFKETCSLNFVTFFERKRRSKHRDAPARWFQPISHRRRWKLAPSTGWLRQEEYGGACR